jgi:hypothetical protein
VVFIPITGIPLPAVEPVPESSVSKVEDRSPEDKERWWKKGLKAISEGKLAVVLLAGGQVLWILGSFCCNIYMVFLLIYTWYIRNYQWIEK